MAVRHDGRTDGCILICRPMMAQDEIRHAPIIAKGGPLAQKRLMQPGITVFED